MEHVTHNNFDGDVVNILAGESRLIFCDKNSQTVTYMVEAGAELTLVDIVTSGKRTESSVVVDLLGSGSSLLVYGLFMGESEDVFSMNHTIRHLASHTSSNIHIRGVLNGKARATYAGTIEIAQGMGGCSGHEEVHTLLLSKDAHIDAVPNLDIGNNDVQCSHAVTITTIDELKKFYLESRGMGEQEAIDTVVNGHVAGLIDGTKNEEIKSKIREMITDVC